jgi:hypothetical protein
MLTVVHDAESANDNDRGAGARCSMRLSVTVLGISHGRLEEHSPILVARLLCV